MAVDDSLRSPKAQHHKPSARGPPAWEGETEPFPPPVPIAQPEPDFQVDQTVTW